MKNRLQLLILICFAISTLEGKSSDLSIGLGTDIPYQFKGELAWKYKSFELSYNTGVLAPPYSDAILSVLGALGTDQIYIDLLEPSFKLGWMNGINPRFYLGRESPWYIGPEFRFDNLNASETSSELIEIVTGQTIPGSQILNRNREIQMSVLLLSAGLRFGRTISLDENKRHLLRAELSFFKHIRCSTDLQLSDQDLSLTSEALNKLLWEEVFLPYGYHGGLGISYSYTIR